MIYSPIYNRIVEKLEERRKNGLFRTIKPVSEAMSDVIDCSSNSYLGLHLNETVASEALRLSGNRLSGNCSSRLIADRSNLYRELENEIASWEETECALVFTSGYTANLGVIQALCTPESEVFTDQLNHASIYDGIRISGCKMSRYNHNDMEHLENLLRHSDAAEKLIVTDTVFSMDGDIAPLADIADLAVRYNALVMVDEAHAAGIFGSKGSGIVEQTGTAEAIAIRMGTLSKAVAGLGGYVAVSHRLRDYLINFCRPLIYSTGLPHSVLAHNLAAIRYIRANPELGPSLLRSAAKFREALLKAGFSCGSGTTQIIPCYVRDEREAVELSSFLRQHNIIVPAIRPPTVPKGTARLRFSWSILHDDNTCDRIISLLKEWKKIYN